MKRKLQLTEVSQDASNWLEYDQFSYNKTLYKTADGIGIGFNVAAAMVATGGLAAEVPAVGVFLRTEFVGGGGAFNWGGSIANFTYNVGKTSLEKYEENPDKGFKGLLLSEWEGIKSYNAVGFFANGRLGALGSAVLGSTLDFSIKSFSSAKEFGVTKLFSESVRNGDGNGYVRGIGFGYFGNKVGEQATGVFTGILYRLESNFLIDFFGNSTGNVLSGSIDNTTKKEEKQ